jgi:thioredoxin-related protein
MVNPHPHFDDKGTLDWQTRYAEALAAAKAQGKLVFIELGRLQCSQCKTLVQNIVTRPDIAPVLQQHYIALAADAMEASSCRLCCCRNSASSASRRSSPAFSPLR